MRLVPNTDTVPASVNKYLLPHERQVITVHQHPAVLIMPIFWALLGLAIAGWLSNALAHGNGYVILAIWILWGIVFLRLVVKAIEWGETYFVVTSQRTAAHDRLGHPQGEHDAARQGDGHELPADRDGPDLLGYGEFIVESAGQDQALSHIRFLPYPEQLYLEVCGLIFKDKDDGSD